jgi:hypothetical protein
MKRTQNRCRRPVVWIPLALFLVLPGSAIAAADGSSPSGITFHDFAARAESGIDYHRTPSKIIALENRIQAQPAVSFGHIIATPEKPRGAPGVALLDFDRDGDVDIYVTNGPGTPNSLFSNQLVERGELGFRDLAHEADVEASAQDSTGVCFGDTDNDGDPDLLVLGRMEDNRFFENLGNGTFREMTVQSGLGGGAYGHASCSFGDIDNDGLLDVAIANSFDWSHRQAIFNVAYALNHPNQLFHNLGDNRFEDISDSSGMRKIRSVDPPIEEGATMSWAIALVDYDQDGDLDLFHADDQAALPTFKARRAHVQVFENDGTGHFTNITRHAGTATSGAWMGLAFADFNCDDRLDFFAANWGDYGFAPIGYPFKQGEWSSRWFLGRPDGTFDDPGVGSLKATPFGWAPMTLDYDNDGDSDVIYLGSLGTAIFTILGDNPGAVLQNQDCKARFLRDTGAMTTVHNRRVVEGAAAGDLNGDGFPDVVSVSSFDIPEDTPQVPFGLDYGSPFDSSAVHTKFMDPAPGGNFVPKGRHFPNGRLVIDLNSGGNGNASIAVRTLGTVGVTTGGRVNRDGIGAIIRFQPEGGPATSRPVTGGANYASQDALEMTFGLGRASKGTLEVHWPGGVHNRLHGVRRGERIVFPEIPCSFDARWDTEEAYRGCVDTALAELEKAGRLSKKDRQRFFDSALLAYQEALHPPASANPLRRAEAAEPTRSASVDTQGDTGKPSIQRLRRDK